MGTHESPPGDSPGSEADDPHRSGTHQPPTFATGHGQVPPVRPPDPIQPFIPTSIPRRRADWPVLVVVMIAAMLVLLGCCLAGYTVSHRP
jgi:hypothetical protein